MGCGATSTGSTATSATPTREPRLQARGARRIREPYRCFFKLNREVPTAVSWIFVRDSNCCERFGCRLPTLYLPPPKRRVSWQAAEGLSLPAGRASYGQHCFDWLYLLDALLPARSGARLRRGRGTSAKRRTTS